MAKKVIIAISVIFGVVVLAGLGVLIWWLVTDSDSNEVVTISELYLMTLLDFCCVKSFNTMYLF